MYLNQPYHLINLRCCRLLSVNGQPVNSIQCGKCCPDCSEVKHQIKFWAGLTSLDASRSYFTPGEASNSHREESRA